MRNIVHNIYSKAYCPISRKIRGKFKSHILQKLTAELDRAMFLECNTTKIKTVAQLEEKLFRKMWREI